MTDQSEFEIIPKKKASKKKVIIVEEEDVSKEEDILIPFIKNENYSDYFARCVTGYHFINTEPINETIWESINSQILELSGCQVKKTSSGSHSSGSDIFCSHGGLSNKSAKYGKHCNEFSVSSYRLTTVCSERDCGNIEAIVNEINSRKNFTYYSIIVREENEDVISYDWYMIPSDYPPLTPEAYTWEPMLGQRGKKTGEQIGWKTNEINGSKMSITFSMSSQLWLSINVTEELKSFIVGKCIVSRKTKLNYLQIYEMYKNV